MTDETAIETDTYWREVIPIVIPERGDQSRRFRSTDARDWQKTARRDKPPGNFMSATIPPVTELAKKLALLEQWAKTSIEYVNTARKANRRKATGIKVLVLSLSGGATILLGLNLTAGTDLQFKNVAFAFTSIVTVLSALEPFFNFRALWVEHEQAKAGFNQLHDQIRFYREGKPESDYSVEAVEGFYADYDKIWSALNAAWSRERRQQEEASASAAAARKSKPLAKP